MTYIRIMIFSVFVAFLFGGCYTTFQHPRVDSGSQWAGPESVAIWDNCMDCHRDPPKPTTTMLPEAALDDYNWYFYSMSAWWEDEGIYESELDAGNYVPPTGGRLPQGGYGGPGGQTVVPVAPAPRTLSKTPGQDTNVSTPSEPEDGRRDFHRRRASQNEKGRKKRSSKRGERR